MTSEHAQRVADTVRAEVARRRVSQARIATALGVSQAAVSRRLVGDVPFDVGEITTVAEVLGVPVSTLLSQPAAVVSA